MSPINASSAPISNANVVKQTINASEIIPGRKRSNSLVSRIQNITSSISSNNNYGFRPRSFSLGASKRQLTVLSTIMEENFKKDFFRSENLSIEETTISVQQISRKKPSFFKKDEDISDNQFLYLSPKNYQVKEKHNEYVNPDKSKAPHNNIQKLLSLEKQLEPLYVPLPEYKTTQQQNPYGHQRNLIKTNIKTKDESLYKLNISDEEYEILFIKNKIIANEMTGKMLITNKPMTGSLPKNEDLATSLTKVTIWLDNCTTTF